MQWCVYLCVCVRPPVGLTLARCDRCPSPLFVSFFLSLGPSFFPSLVNLFRLPLYHHLFLALTLPAKLNHSHVVVVVFTQKKHTRTKTHTHRRLLAHITKRKYAYHGSVMGNERSVSVTQLKTFGIRLWLQTLNVCCVRTCVCRVFTLGVHVVTGLLLRLIQLISSPQRLIICHLTGVGLLCVSTLWSVRVFVYTLCPYLYAYSIYVSGSLVSDWQSNAFSNWGMNGIILKRILNALRGSYIFKQNIKCKYDLC